MAAEYQVLSHIYDALGLHHFAEQLTPRLIDYAQRHDWLGRRILELGCGTGGSLLWLTQHNYMVIGIDESAEMLAACRDKLHDQQHDLRLEQIQTLDPDDYAPVDMVLALDVINEITSLRDMEAVFQRVWQCLDVGKLFIFDLYTLQALAALATPAERMLHNSANLSVMTSRQFDFERQLLTIQYVIFTQQPANGLWQRTSATHTRRGYPMQAISSLLQRCGFTVKAIIDTQLSTVDVASVTLPDRIIFLAEKPTHE